MKMYNSKSGKCLTQIRDSLCFFVLHRKQSVTLYVKDKVSNEGMKQKYNLNIHVHLFFFIVLFFFYSLLCFCGNLYNQLCPILWTRHKIPESNNPTISSQISLH